MRKEQKVERVQGLHEVFDKAACAVLVDFRGMDVAEMTHLRGLLREQKVTMTVVKNTLAKRALADTKMATVTDLFDGPTAIVVSTVDPVAPAKVLTEFVKKNEFLKIKAAVVDGTPYSASDLTELAKLPGRQQLLGQFAGTMQAPLQKFVGGFNALLCQLVYALQALEEKKANQ